MCGLPRWINSEYQSLESSSSKSEYCPEYRHAGGQRRKYHRDNRGHQSPESYAEDATHRGQSYRFQSKLQENVPLARADGLPHSDFTGSFRDGHEHDIHHAHAADDQGYGGHRQHEDKNASRELIPYIGEGILSEHSEVIGLLKWNAPATPEKFAHLILQQRHIGL